METRGAPDMVDTTRPTRSPAHALSKRLFLLLLTATLPCLQGCPGALNFSGPDGSVRARTGPGGANVSVRTPEGGFDLDAGRHGGRMRIRAPGMAVDARGGKGGGNVRIRAHQARNFVTSKLREIAGALKGDPRQWENIKSELDAWIDLQRG